MEHLSMVTSNKIYEPLKTADNMLLWEFWVERNKRIYDNFNKDFCF